jgi:hypothetical protein
MKWRVFFFALSFAVSAYAHVMSMSTGEATVTGNRVEYVLRMPLYEVAHTAHPEKSLLEQIRFAGGRIQHQQCFADKDDYVCAADYLFDRPVEKLDITCTLYAVTVPNHVHVLHAEKGGRRDQAFFDYTFTSSVIRFDPPTELGIATRQIVEGAYRAVGGLVQVLFLFTLAMAARTKRELMALIGAFLAGLVGGALISWHPAPRFAECAAALSVAYLAIEILFLPDGKMRWLIAAVLGIFQGMYLALFRGGSNYFLAGAAFADAIVCIALGLLFIRRMPRLALSIPLAAGLIWFFVRLLA